jgi:hypothetical protein
VDIVAKAIAVIVRMDTIPNAINFFGTIFVLYLISKKPL